MKMQSDRQAGEWERVLISYEWTMLKILLLRTVKFSQISARLMITVRKLLVQNPGQISNN